MEPAEEDQPQGGGGGGGVILEKRHGHVAAKYKHYMMVWGGYQDRQGQLHSDFLPTTQILCYEPLTARWSVVQTGAEHAPPGTSGACALVLDNRLYIFGGYCEDLENNGGNTNRLFVLDLVTLTWRQPNIHGRLPLACDKMTGWVHQRKLYFFGGFGLPPYSDPYFRDKPCTFHCDFHNYYSNRGWNNQLVAFNPLTEQWEWPDVLGPEPLPRAAHASAKCGDNVYIFGGRNCDVRMNDLHRLDMKTLMWSGSLRLRSEDVPQGRSWHSLTALSSQLMVLYGGFSQESTVLGDCWLIDVTTLYATQLLLPFYKTRHWHSACIGDPGEMLIFGGGLENPSDTPHRHTTELITFWLTPKPLLRLCLDTIDRNRMRLLPLFAHLPHSLVRLLQQRQAAVPITGEDGG